MRIGQWHDTRSASPQRSQTDARQKVEAICNKTGVGGVKTKMAASR